MDTSTAILVFGLFVIALTITVSAFVFKHMALSMVSAILWLSIGGYCLFMPAMPIATALGIICILMSVVMFISPSFIKEKQAEIINRPYAELMAERIDRMRNTNSSFRARRKMEDIL